MYFYYSLDLTCILENDFIEIPFMMVGQVGQKNYVSNGSLDPSR